MTPTTSEIFEKHQVRKTKKQKTDFISYITEYAEKKGYKAKTENGAMGARNIVVGDIDNAKVVYTAHYDTCAGTLIPNIITPANILLYVMYQLLIVAVFFAIAFAIGFGFSFIVLALDGNPEDFKYIAVLVYWVLLFSLMFGPANKHTANDNTSGVTLLVDILTDLPESMRDQAAFIFFDKEESGLIGSSSFAKAHKAQMEDKLLINFDCVSEGNDFIFVLRKKAKDYKQTIEKAFAGNERFTVHVLTKGYVYPSDQANFNVGIGVAACNKTKKGLLYLSKIHTKRDTVYTQENIDFLKEKAIALINDL